jgi:hypothetical protein
LVIFWTFWRHWTQSPHRSTLFRETRPLAISPEVFATINTLGLLQQLSGSPIINRYDRYGPKVNVTGCYWATEAVNPPARFVMPCTQNCPLCFSADGRFPRP